MSEILIVEGGVSTVGYYSDCVPTLVVRFKKEKIAVFDFSLNRRIDVTLLANGRKYFAGLRTSSSTPYFKLCPDLFDEAGIQTRLADVLFGMNITKKEKIILIFEKHLITIKPS